jgi:adenylyltransferase/sulfurtransferase
VEHGWYIVTLSQEQFERYRNQLALPGMSEQAQSRLLAGTVAVVGLSSWGSLAAQYLADVGIGRLIAADDQEETLKRLDQSLKRSSRNNPDTQITLKQWRFNATEAEPLLSGAHAVVDGLENWQHKLIISDLCMQLKKPLVHAGGSGFRFQVYTMMPLKSACLRCVFPEVGMDDVPLTPTDTSTLSPVSAMIGALQALETIKIVAKLGASQGNELWKFDWLSGEFETVRGLDPRFDCPDCGRNAR